MKTFKPNQPNKCQLVYLVPKPKAAWKPSNNPGAVIVIPKGFLKRAKQA